MPQPKSQRPESSPVTKGRSTERKSFRKRIEEAPSWDDVPSGLISALVCSVTTRGGSPTFGYTRDGSALLVAVYYRDKRMVDYLSGKAEFEEYLEWVLYELLELTDKEALEYLQAKLQAP